MNSTLLRESPGRMAKDCASYLSPPRRWLDLPHRHPWPARYWQGAWLTESGYIIRSWMDEIHAADVLEAKARR